MMTAVCFDTCSSFRGDWEAASSVEKPISPASFSYAGNSAFGSREGARMIHAFENRLPSDEMEANACLQSSLSSAVKEGRELLKLNVGDTGPKRDDICQRLDTDDAPDAKISSQLDVCKSTADQMDDNSNHCSQSEEYTATLEYGLKLGYDEDLIRSILKRRGASISRDELLKELIEKDRSLTFGVCEPIGESPFSPPVNKESTSNKDEKQTVNCDLLSLRPIIIDGSNVAISHGNKKVFSCRGIGIAVDWFKQRGHKEITVFVPQWRKENAKQVPQITHQEILSTLEQEKIVVFTPSRRVNNKRIVCYDDRYILNLAVENGGIVVSNDNYRDLIAEKPEFKKVIEERLLMYSFVNDRFMPPDDPLGRHGPSLDSFLRKDPTSNSLSLQPCPYARKCTYGNKCKFYHPERVHRALVPVSQQITESSQSKIKELKRRGLSVSCVEKPSLDRKNSSGLNASPSKSPPELVDLSPIAISLLAGGKSQFRHGANVGLERHSLPLPWPSTVAVKHESLRPVRSDPLRLCHPVGCSGHLALAEKLSRENYVAWQQQQQLRQPAAYGGGSSSDIRWSHSDMRMDGCESENRHSLLCRTSSVGGAFEAQKSSSSVKKSSSAVPLIDGAALYRATRGFAENRIENNPDLFTERSHLSRMHSAPFLFQTEAQEKDLAAAMASPSQPPQRQKMVLHRVGTGPLVEERAMASFYAPGADLTNGSFQQNSRGIPLQRQNVLLSGGSANSVGNCFHDNCWTNSPHVKISVASSQMNNRSLSSSSSASSPPPPAGCFSRGTLEFSPIQQTSTFHFGQNSSYQFVPSTRENAVVPPFGNSRVPPGFSAENSGNAKGALFVRLCLLFDAADVRRVMTEHPDETDTKVLCGHLLQLDQQRKQQAL